MNYPLSVRSPILASFVTSNVSTHLSAVLITSIRLLPKRFPDHALGALFMYLRASWHILCARVRACRGIWIATLFLPARDRDEERLRVLRLYHDDHGGVRRPYARRWPRSGSGGKRRVVRADLPGHCCRSTRGQSRPQALALTTGPNRANVAGVGLLRSVPKTFEPVEKVVVGPVGSPKHLGTKAKILRNRGSKLPSRAREQARRSFSTRWSVFTRVRNSPG